MPELSVGEVAALVGGEVEGDAARRVRGLAPLYEARPDHLSFVANPRELPYVHASSAGAVLVARSLARPLPPGAAAVRVDDVLAALAAVLPVLHPQADEPPSIHPTAVIGEGSELGAEVSVGACAVIGRGVRIGDGARIGAHVVIGDGCHVGAGSILHPHAVLYPDVRLGAGCTVQSGACLGPDGFGYAFVEGAHRKIPQVGGVRVGGGAEFGANATVDRGSIGQTWLGDGCATGDLVHVGHNARLGASVLLDAHTGVAGSATLGDGVVVGGQVAIVGHLTVGDGVRVAHRGGITHDVPAGESVAGTPARPRREARRADALLFRLPRLVKRLLALERAVLGRGARGEGA
ncbi:MAG TPA: UDP-3-O-(3-hydroxymyristoyl)glucosamine N-acyltransferase [Longimicrobiaceae bacterium]|nr:UDP-3-O-(3-hydroxymyristoyl)glucosamine N-acyltransferase [Longimicrobiaceae bacterium]